MLINVGIHTVRKNPLNFGVWGVGLLICLFFNGLKVTPQQEMEYSRKIEQVRLQSDSVAETWRRRHDAELMYRQSQGWFWSCDRSCQANKLIFNEADKIYQKEKDIERKAMQSAKQSVGLFSEYGVGDCRWLFNQQFASGKQFAKRQTQWDALFMGIQFAMGRDENIVNYIFRLLMNLLVNLTLGGFGALIGFLFNLWSLIVEYHTNVFVGVSFFVLAALAAFSFSFAWLMGIYFAAAGTVYVGGKFLIANMRIADDDGRRTHRVN